MTRWKREGVTVIREMHAHHRWSRTHELILQTAESLGLNVARHAYSNPADGSTSIVWYVSRHALARVGGLKAIEKMACDRLLGESRELG